MATLIQFILAVIGLVILTNKSVFFQPTRKFFERKYNANTSNVVYWFFYNNLHCSMCMAVWAGAMCCLPVHFQVIWVLWPLIATATVTFAFKQYDRM